MGVDTEGAKDPKEDFRVVHDAVEVFRTRALGHEYYIVGRMAFARFSGCRRLGQDGLLWVRVSGWQ